VFELINPNNGTDLNTANNQRTVSFTVINPTPIVSIPVFQGAETTPFPGNNWSILNLNNNVTWTSTTAASGLGNSNRSFRMDNYSTDISGQSDFIISPYMDFSAAATPLRLNFNVAYARYSTTSASDSLIISISTNCGETWTRIYNKGSIGLSTVGNTVVTTSFVPTATQWRNETLNLNNYIGNDKVQIRFQNKSNYGNNLYIDDINIANSFTSIDEFEQTLTIDVFPNPAQGVFTVSSGNNANIQEIRIFDTIGKEVYHSTEISGNKKEIRAAFERGIYFVKVSANNQQIIKKIIINK
jgi:hypothetical protein